jgi:two-component system, chemotaxis family, protein-glutamate methylesterase/glutaminase
MSKIGKRAPRLAAIVIGASAGAVEALSRILPALPAGFALPVLLVVHIPSDRENLLIELFRPQCRVAVKEAEDKEHIRPGTVYVAPPDYHLLVERDGRLSLSSEEPVLFSRPSIDLLFESAADAYGSGLAGVILTGASRDGANGLRAVCEAGGVALVQDPASAQSPVMPRAALEACPDARVCTLEQVASFLTELETTIGS